MRSQSRSCSQITHQNISHSNNSQQAACQFALLLNEVPTLSNPVSGDFSSDFCRKLKRKTPCMCGASSRHSIPSRFETATCLKVSEVEGGESGGLWARARCHCSIKKREGFFFSSNGKEESC